MAQEGAKTAATKQTNSKAELSNFKLELEEIKEEFKKFLDMYSGPLLETNRRITNQVRKMEEDHNKNAAAIALCQKEIEELRVTINFGPSAKTALMTSVQDLFKQAT